MKTYTTTSQEIIVIDEIAQEICDLLEAKQFTTPNELSAKTLKDTIKIIITNKMYEKVSASNFVAEKIYEPSPQENPDWGKVNAVNPDECCGGGCGCHNNV